MRTDTSPAIGNPVLALRRSVARPTHAPGGMWRPRRVVVLLTAALLATLGAFAIQLLLARTHLAAAQRDLLAARSGLTSPAALRRGATREQVQRTIQDAHSQFAAAHADLRLWSWLLPHLGSAPSIGPQLAVAPAVAGAGDDATAAMLHLLAGFRGLWPAMQSRSQTPMFARLTAVLDAGRPQFHAAAAESSRAVAALYGAPQRTGNPQRDHALAEFRGGLIALRTLSAWSVALPELLGARKPNSLLIGWVDPREIRAGGGFIGSANFLTANRGIVTTHPGSAARFVHEFPVPLPLPEAEYTQEGFLQFCDSNWSPDFPLTGRLERWTYGKDTGRWADTVVNVPGAAAARLLRATGPVYIPAYGQWITADNAEDIATRYIYTTYRGPSDAQHDEQRKRFMGEFMRAFLHRLGSLPLERWPRLAQALSEGVDHQDILLYDRRPEVERAIALSGAAGEMAPVRGDYLMVVDDNRSYNKLAPYIRQQARYDITLSRDGWAHAALTLQYHVLPSPDDIEGVGPYWGMLGSKHDLQEFLRVYVPPDAVLEGTSGLDKWAPEQAYHRTQFAGRILVHAGERLRVIIRYRLPAGVIFPAGPDRYSLLVQRQVGTGLAGVQVRVHTDGGGKLSATPLNPAESYNSWLPLTHIQNHLSLHVSGLPQPATPRLAPYSGDDPYLPYGKLGDPRHPF